MYQSFYNLLATYIFEGAVEVGSFADLVCTEAATFFSLLLVALPFVVIWKIVSSVIR